MNDRNSYFAAVFSRELERWKKENNKSQEDFAIAIGLSGKNMITRYKKGTAYPEPENLERICKVLSVEASVFYPSTFEDRLSYDADFRDAIYRNLEKAQYDALREAGIDPAFWGFLWRAVPYTETLFPIFNLESEDETPLFLKKTTDGVVDVYEKDLEFVRKLQEDVIKYVNMQLIKTALDQSLKCSVVDFRSETALSKRLDELFSVLALDLLNSGRKDITNGND